MTTAILLAAGVGSRLRPLTDDRPKCLVSLGAETILGRQLRLLAAAGVREVVVSTGWAAEALRAALAEGPLPWRAVHNPDFDRTQNIVSFARALAITDGAVVKLDADVVFGSALLPRLFAAGGAAAVAVDERQPVRDEAMKVRARGAFADAFGKGLAASDAFGESIGIEWFSTASRPVLDRVMAGAEAAGRSDAYYEDLYGDVVAGGIAMRLVPVGDLPWTEVDDVDDLRRAKALAPSLG